MLQLLHIENIAVIERADIAFDRGFHALTGETGAGKSIVIDALGAVLGQRTSRDLIRTGAEKAFVSALFADVKETDALRENGITPESDGTLLLQRELFADGRNVCRAGTRPLTVAQLRAIGTSLVNIHGQHDGQQLLEEEQHLIYLDRFGGLEAEREAYAALYRVWRETEEQIRALQMDDAEKERRVDMLRHQIAELERAELKPGEEEALTARLAILRNGEKYLSALAAADELLNGGETALGAVSAITEAKEALSPLLRWDASFSDALKRLEAVRCEVYDLATTVRDKRAECDFSPQELDEMEERADQLYRIRKKYGATVEDCIEYLARSRRELDEIAYSEDRIAQLTALAAKQEAAADAAAQTLSAHRRDAAARMEEAILRELRELDMPKVRFCVAFAPQKADATGADNVRYLLSANAGEDLKPIDRIASGGELARIMLAMKNVLAHQDAVDTMVFDEVDTGVSGRAAQRVAEKLARISREKQVLCVTHLVQLAAMADVHLGVAKGEENGRTYTEVVSLDRARRREELARLTGGEMRSDAILQGAEELLAAAEKFKETL